MLPKMLWCLRLLTVLPGASLYDNETDFLLKRTITVLVFIWDSSLRGNKAWLMKPGESTTSCSLLKRHLQLHESALSCLPVVLDSLSLNDQRAFISRESGRRCQPFQSSRPPLCHPNVLFHHPSLSLSFSFSFSFSCLICFAVLPSNTHIQQHNRQPFHLSASNSRIWKSKTKDGMLTSSSLVLRKNEDRTL